MATLYEHWNTGDNTGHMVLATSWLAQTFTPSVNHIITSVKLKLYRIGDPGTLTVSIKATTNDLPSGIDKCVGTVGIDDITLDTGGEWVEVTFTTTALLLASTKYAIVARVLTQTPGNNAVWRGDNISPVYTDGAYCSSADSGESWAENTDITNMFEEWGDPVVAPSVTTDPATEVEEETATGKGNITDNGGENCDHRGIVYGKTSKGHPGNTAPESSGYDDYEDEPDDFGIGAFTRSLTGLDSGTKYYVRAYAHNSAGYSYGNEVSFTTLVAIPSVTTEAMTDVEPTTATGNGNVTHLGGEGLSQHGHCWSTSHDPTTSNDKTELGAKSETGAFTSSLTGLSPNTVYYCRAYATNSAGTSYGSEVTFTTPVGPPTVTTEAASAIGLNQATLNGILDSDGGEPCYCGFQWGETIPYSTTTPTQRKVTGEKFSQTILHLREATQYHFRAFAKNSAETRHGDDRTLDTLFRTNKAYALARYEV